MTVYETVYPYMRFVYNRSTCTDTMVYFDNIRTGTSIVYSILPQLKVPLSVIDLLI